MSPPAALLPWLADVGRRPLCPVPWEGNTVVTSDGAVQLCCFSDAIVGNVNEAPFAAIWNGKAMQRIRSTLVAGALPPECRSGSCPIFRGDDRHYLIDRRDGAFRAGEAAAIQAAAAARLQGSLLALPGRARRGERLHARLELCYRGEAVRADLFVCLRLPDGTLRFLPDGADFPVPFAASVTVQEPGGSWPLLDVVVDAGWPAGDLGLSASLFLPGSDPNLPQHCHWAVASTCHVAP